MKAVKIIVAVLLIFLVLGGLAVGIRLLDNGGSKYFVSYGNTQASDSTSIDLAENAYSVFYVGDFLSMKNVVPATDYKVTVRAVKETFEHMTFTLDGKTKALDGTIDFSAAFSVCKEDGRFSIFIPQNYRLADIMKTVYSNNTVQVDEPNGLWEKDCFQVVVEFSKEKTTIPVPFH